MNRPDDIEERAWQKALETARVWYHEEWDETEQIQVMLVEAIARAIAGAVAEERERCAKVTEKLLRLADTTSAADQAIAAAIRNGERQDSPSPLF